MLAAVLHQQIALDSPKAPKTITSSGTLVREKRQQLDQFLASVERRALRTAEYSVRNRDDALEIVQDSMMKLVQRYADANETDWAPLFHRILHSRLMDFHRRKKVMRGIFSWFTREDEDGQSYNPVDFAEAQGIQNPLERLDLEQANTCLVKAVESLPERQRQAFLLRYWEGLSERDTAFAMQCSEGSVKTHLSRAIQRLRVALQEYAL